MLNITQIQMAFELALTSYCVSCVLMKQGMLLEWYLDLLLRVENHSAWIAKPLGLCEKCLGGQMALWTWLVLHRDLVGVEAMNTIPAMVVFISITIVLTGIIKKVAK